MVFSSLTFLFLFFPIVIGVYYLCPRALRNLWLLAASLLFYAWGEPVYIRLMVASILFNYLCGLGVAALQKREKKRLAKGLLILCIAGNIGALGLFKYADLLIGTVNNIAGSKIALLELALPIGISFYTFQALSYVIDVYRGTVAAQKNPITFGTYIALFPQLIAGPIVQYKTVEEQLSHRRETTAQFAAGIGRFTIGLGKKVLIANQVGALWDTVAALPGTSLSAGTAWLGAIAFTFQIYFDFSGYSDMAIGLGKMLGFEFLENFNYPYLSRSITEYWRRWHISLSGWFRDYVYIPLGGSRCRLRRTCLNLLIVFTLTGLWHGAAWQYVVFGLLHGVILCLERLGLGQLLSRLPKFFRHLYTVVVLWATLIIFGAPGLREGLAAWRGILTWQSGARGYTLAAFADTKLLLILAASFLLCGPLQALSPRLKKALYERNAPSPAGMVLLLVLLFLGLMRVTAGTYSAFIYFQF